MSTNKLSSRGVHEFVLQRVSALVLLLYTLHFLWFLLRHPNLSYVELQQHFNSVFVAVFTSIAMVMILIHTWIGMWTVGTDYLRQNALGRAADSVRRLYEIVVIVGLLLFLAFGLNVVWRFV